jgi:hypothetical protein
MQHNPGTPGQQQAAGQYGPHPIQQLQQMGTPPQHAQHAQVLPPPGPLLQQPQQQQAPPMDHMAAWMQQTNQLVQQNGQLVQAFLQFVQQQQAREHGRILPSQAVKHDHFPVFSGFTKADEEDADAKLAGRRPASHRDRTHRVMTSLMDFLSVGESWMARNERDPALPHNHESCMAMMDLMLSGEAHTWLTQAKALNPGLTYPRFRQMLIDHYVPEEEVKALRHAVQNFRWSGKATMREHCDTFMLKLQRLVTFTNCSAAQAWMYFKDSVERCQAARQVIEIKGWNRADAQPALQEAINTLCKVVDEPSTSYGASTSTGGGPAPMDIGALSALTSELQELKLQLAALGAEPGRGRGRERDNRGGGYGRGYSEQRGRGYSEQRGRSPERGRGGGWGGGRDQSPQWRRGQSAPPRIENLRRHRKWPRWAANLTQADIDKAVAEYKCFLCGGEQHMWGWYECPQRDRSRTPTPIRQGRGGNPNGYRAQSPGR